MDGTERMALGCGVWQDITKSLFEKFLLSDEATGKHAQPLFGCAPAGESLLSTVLRPLAWPPYNWGFHTTTHHSTWSTASPRCTRGLPHAESAPSPSPRSSTPPGTYQGSRSSPVAGPQQGCFVLTSHDGWTRVPSETSVWCQGRKITMWN